MSTATFETHINNDVATVTPFNQTIRIHPFLKPLLATVMTVETANPESQSKCFAFELHQGDTLEQALAKLPYVTVVGVQREPHRYFMHCSNPDRSTTELKSWPAHRGKLLTEITETMNEFDTASSLSRLNAFHAEWTNTAKKILGSKVVQVDLDYIVDSYGFVLAERDRKLPTTCADLAAALAEHYSLDDARNGLCYCSLLFNTTATTVLHPPEPGDTYWRLRA